MQIKTDLISIYGGDPDLCLLSIFCLYVKMHNEDYMAGFGNLAEEFEKNSNNGPEERNESKAPTTVQRSIAIVRTVDKMKAQGIKVTKKAELDYILALRVLERSGVDLPLPEPGEPVRSNEQVAAPLIKPDIKRNPKTHPVEFQQALTYSRQVVAEVQGLWKQGKAATEKQLAEYELCQKFLKKWASPTSEQSS